MVLLGQMESTLLTSFLKASKIKRWLANPEAPPIVRQIKSLYDRIYTPNTADNGDMDDEGTPQTRGINGLAIPKDLRPLLRNNEVEIHLQARLKRDGFIYARSTTHKGNSQVFFYPNGDKKLAPVAGIIQYIYSESAKSNITFLAVQRALPADASTIDPFAKYMHWPARLYKSRFDHPCERIQSSWIAGHFARWDYTSDHMVVVSLNRVSALISYLLLLSD